MVLLCDVVRTSVTFSIISILTYGGPLTMIWGWPVVGLLTIIVGLSMAKIVLPTLLLVVSTFGVPSSIAVAGVLLLLGSLIKITPIKDKVDLYRIFKKQNWRSERSQRPLISPHGDAPNSSSVVSSWRGRCVCCGADPNGIGARHQWGGSGGGGAMIFVVSCDV
ncbi:hypothetical protein LWI28_011004 [Acer negundo]|uniref:Uncharacterized protein n=1 Tax=Acer negundo TaxID=4023 RepID=A0AAD5IM37_ACENE|nr:hypothetical protein LWI28_011004 [Acer negundo]